MPRTLILGLALLVAAPAFAQEAPQTRVDIRNNVLSAAALNSTQTITADLQGTSATFPSAYAKARLAIFYTYSAATAVTVKFYCAPDGTNYAQMTARDISGSTATISKITDSYTTGAASANYMLEYDLRGCRKAKWELDGTGAGAGDLVTADLSLIAGN